MDLISGLFDSIYELYDRLNQLLADFEKLVEYGTYYVYISGGLLIVIFVILIIQSVKISSIKKQNKKILEYLKEKDEI